MAGDHGDHPADSLVSFPAHVARQVVLNGHGSLVDQAGNPIGHDFEPDPVAEEVLDGAQVVTPPPTTPVVAPTGRKRAGKAAKVTEPTPAPEAETEIDPGEWETEE